MHTLPPETTTDDSAHADTHRYRAATFDEAVALANDELGEHVEIVEANRIRRGGLGGFFATDLGVEIVVRPATPTSREPLLPVAPLEGGSAIDRLLALVDAQERAGRSPAPTTDFGAALQRELRAPAPKPEQSSEDWSVEAYRRLAIPAHATAPQPAPEPAPEPELEPEPTLDVEPAADPSAEHELAIEPRVPAPAPRAPRPRRQAGGLAERVSQAAQAAVAQSADAEHAALPIVAAGPAEPVPSQTVGLVTEAATALFSQLSNMPVVTGSQAANVRKLTVSVAGPAGSVIEISAELGA